MTFSHVFGWSRKKKTYQTSYTVTSGVTKGSVLELVLFIIYIKDIDVKLNFITKFAANTEIGNSVISYSDKQSLQEDLNIIPAWSDGYEMHFNINNYHILRSETRRHNMNTR